MSNQDKQWAEQKAADLWREFALNHFDDATWFKKSVIQALLDAREEGMREDRKPKEIVLERYVIEADGKMRVEHPPFEKPSEPARDVKEIATKVYDDWCALGCERVGNDIIDAIASALQAERDRAACNTITSIGDAAEQIVELKATLEECRGVLKPFLAASKIFDAPIMCDGEAAPDDSPLVANWPIESRLRLELTVGHCRAAAKTYATLLSKLTPPTP